MTELMQDVIATAVAAGAAALVVRRALGFVAPGKRESCPSCPSCPSRKERHASGRQAAPSLTELRVIQISRPHP
jgi:hypothetical protein